MSAHTHSHAPSPRFSLLRLSIGVRLAGVGALVALLWLAVFWALD